MSGVHRLLIIKHQFEGIDGPEQAHACVVNRDLGWLNQTAPAGIWKVPARALITQGFEVLHDPDGVVKSPGTWLRDYCGDGEPEPEIIILQTVCLRLEDGVWVDDQGESEGPIQEVPVHLSSYDGHGKRILIRPSPRLKAFWQI